MADNVDVTEGAGKTIATDDVGGTQYQRIKLDLGGDGLASPLVRGQQTTANSIPVALASDASLAVVATNAGTFAVQAAQSGTWNVGTVTAVTAISNALPAGTNAIGKLAANSGVDIGDVDVTSLPAIPAGSNLIGRIKPEGDEYETVAASATDQVLGPTGAAGDYLAGVLIVPATTSPGAVSIKDGTGSAITIFTGGASSVSNLVPFMVPLGMTSLDGAWKLTTATNVSCIAVGTFT